MSDLEMRELCIQVLRQAYAGERADYTLGLNPDLIRHLGWRLAQRKGWDSVPNPTGHAELVRRDPTGAAHALFLTLQDPVASGIVEFVICFVRAGFAFPLGAPQALLPDVLRLTRAGHRFLKCSEEHPLLPGFLERLAARCPGLPDDLLSLVADARSCLDHGLMRPAVVLLGVAYELAIEHVFDALVSRGSLSDTGQKAAARISAIRGSLDALLPGKSGPAMDDRLAAVSACDYASDLRRRRNEASHTKPTYGFEDREEVEELIVSAGRHLPNLWRLH